MLMMPHLDYLAWIPNSKDDRLRWAAILPEAASEERSDGKV